MATRSEPLPAVQTSSWIDQSAIWFWNFLKQELSPYPGRLWVVGRITISATIVMLLVMIFRIPGGFQGAIFTLILSREHPKETFLAGFKTLASYLVGTAYVVLTIVMLIDDPLTHVLWIAGSLFLFFYLLRIVVDYGSAVAMGFAVLGAISLWDNNALSVNTRLENTLWLALAVGIAVVVTVVVEYVFRGLHPASDLTEGIQARMQTVEKLLRSVAGNQSLDAKTRKQMALYSSVGTSRLRRLVVRSDYSPRYKEQMGAAISLLGRVVDIAASFHLALDSSPIESLNEANRARLLRLADQIAVLERGPILGKLPGAMEWAAPQEPSSLPFLPEMERTVALIPSAFSGSRSVKTLVPVPLDEEGPLRFLASDAFSNPAYVYFALRGTLAAMACYIFYTAVDWPGISTSVVTCYITALSTIGSSRQKQVLRLAGTAIGGFIFGMGAQIFVLPYFDTITGFTVVFALVTAIAGWIATSSARLSYLGVQLGLAYYLIHLQEFAIQTSIGIARDRVVGVLVGLISMGVFFDLLWVKPAVDEMKLVFARNLEIFAELAEEMLNPDRIQAIQRIRKLRDQLNAGFGSVRAQSDAVLLEFGPSRQHKLKIRDDIRRWQPSILTLLQVQVTSAQYLAQRPLEDLPGPIAEAGVAFEKEIAEVMRALSDEVNGKLAQKVPDIRASAERFDRAVESYYRGVGTVVPSQASDVAGLARSLATILAPLYDDIHATLSAHAAG